MAKEMKRITCAAGVYTQISTGQANVSFLTTLVYGGRVAFGATQPAANTEDYHTVHPSTDYEFGSLGLTDYLWYKPNSAAETLEVIRG